MNPTALITGASSGLGYEFAKLYAANGYNLIITARNEEKLQKLKDELNHIEVTIIPKDLSQPEASKELYQYVVDKDLQVSALVNNAGFGLNGYFDELSLQEQQDMLQVNITALTELTHYFLPSLKKAANQGLSAGILNVASTAAFQPGPKMAVYYASKSYVLSFSEAMAEELKDSNVHVTTLCPGATETNFFKTAKAENSKLTSSTMSPQMVAKAGFEGYMKKQRVIVPGRINRVSALAAKFVPRSVAARIAQNMNSANS
ncbi:SDR family oxidoreductase [Pontibacillus sp. ALD_SL1]|uniref:SDR family NAD(P)-dependent oxidoreductase n=1 Tax=Pontibacillus sp. ALD_SL1 TaxID=2777185 RepID=UPI001A96C984|nr:SDR family oxidoreductase [Pontibacillus sp. ALD_SL1]QST00521.1 SDR family oxidoreductase [Pontibacillus sp. ALD_SL1]